MRRPALYILPLAAALVCAQETSPCTVEGAVTDSASGAPIQGATLILNSGTQPKVIDSATNAFGKFTLHLAPGAYVVIAAAKGYSRKAANLQCASSDTLTNFNLQLPAEAVISGRITGDDGLPAPGATVTMLRVAYPQGNKRLLPAGGAVADAHGQFRLDNLSGGVYYLVANVAARAQADGRGSDGKSEPAELTAAGESVAREAQRPTTAADRPYVATFYPSAIDLDAAAPVRVRVPGEIGGTDIRLQRARAFAIRGTLTGGDPMNYVVSLMPADARRFAPHVTIHDAKGRFAFHSVVPGSYTLIARQAGATVAPSAWLKIDVADADLNDIELPLTPGATAAGTIAFEDKNQPDVPATLVRFIPTDSLDSPYVAPAKEGKFSAAGIPLGAYRVLVGPLPRADYAKALRMDGRDVPDWIVALSEAGVHSFQIDLAANAGAVTGFARDGGGNPTPNILVTLVPRGSVPLTTPRYSASTSDSQGRFLFSGVPPGKYKVYAWEKAPPGLVQNRDVLGQFESQAADVEVQPGITASADAGIIGASATASLE